MVILNGIRKIATFATGFVPNRRSWEKKRFRKQKILGRLKGKEWFNFGHIRGNLSPDACAMHLRELIAEGRIEYRLRQNLTLSQRERIEIQIKKRGGFIPTDTLRFQIQCRLVPDEPLEHPVSGAVRQPETYSS